MNEKPVLMWDIITDNPVDLQDEWECMCESLTAIMKELNPYGYAWRAEVTNFGWQELDGEKHFYAWTGEELLQEVLPDTDCIFFIYMRDGYIAINNYHHDSPWGKEWYYVYPE